MKNKQSEWKNLPIEDILAPLAKGAVISQGWSPQCEKEPSLSEKDWGVLKTTAIQTGYFLENENKKLPKNLVPRPQHEVKKGDMLMTCAGPRNRCGVVCLVRKTRIRLMISGKMYRFRINEEVATPEFVEAYLLSQKAWKEIDVMKTGISDSGLNLTHSKFKKLLIPLPSLLIQKKIVSKIEELFSELDKGIENLRLAQQQLKTYRQAVLKWAFEGKLTNENVKEGELPEGWKWKTLKEITSLLGDGLHGTPRYSDKGEFFFINGNNLSDGKIVFKDSTKRVDINEYQKHKKELNDTTILVSINGTLGNTAFYNGEKVILGKSACYFNLYPLVNKHYIRYIITSQRFINYAEETATGSTIPNVSLKAMREFTVPIPSIDEQIRIVQEIESRLSVADKTDKIISDSLNRVESLRQSILKKAFEGML